MNGEGLMKSIAKAVVKNAKQLKKNTGRISLFVENRIAVGGQEGRMADCSDEDGNQQPAFLTMVWTPRIQLR